MDRAARVAGARRMNIDVAGGGAHPFQNWSEQRITPSDRFNELHRKYGYLAKTFTVFGQHIHIGVANGDDAMYLTHGFARSVPHFTALSAASPFSQGVDTAFDSSRSNVVRAFPLAGTAPPVVRWSDFESYYDGLKQAGIVGSIKDFYWDIRPKPENGTVEIRVCDTPLTIEHAAQLGCYAQLLARWLLTERPFEVDANFYLLYQHNRFAASRYGLEGEIAIREAGSAEKVSKSPIFIDMLDHMRTLQRLRHMAYRRQNDATWLRQTFRQRGSLNDMMRLSSQLWMEKTAAPCFSQAA